MLEEAHSGIKDGTISLVQGCVQLKNRAQNILNISYYNYEYS